MAAAMEKNDTSTTVRNSQEHADVEKQQSDPLPEEVKADASIDPAPGTVPTTPRSPSFPDGGVEAWLVVLGAGLVIFSTFGLLNAFGVWESYYLVELGFSSSQISWVGAFQLCLQFGLGAPVGFLFDLGYFRQLTIIGTCFYIVGFFTLSVSRSYYQVFLSQGVAMGIGLALLFLPAVSIVSHWFLKKRPVAAGLVTSFSSLGGVVLPIMANNLLEKQGFKITILSMAGLVTGCLIIAQFLFKTRLPSRKERIAISGPPPPVDMKGIITDLPYLVFVLGLFLVLMGIFTPIFYCQLYAQTNGIDPTLAFYSLSILNAGSIPGRILPNLAAQRFGPLNMMSFFVIATGAMTFAWLGSKNGSGALIIWALLFGFFSGAYVSLMAPCMFRFSRNVEEVGIRLGLAFFFVSFAALIGSPIAGYILGGEDGVFHWTNTAVYAGVFIMAGGVCIGTSRMLQASRKNTQIV